MSRRIDRAFARFRTQGDPNALARVFDATAADLYRLAWHLTGDRHAAEDLVQTTFLAAIEDAAQHAPERAVLPWLCGILTNRARMRWRRLRAERAAAPPPPAAAADPSKAAELGELSAVARDRLHALPEPYRRPCVLHVEQGLGAAEIARLLARPDATVRSQLQRGLDLLRRALPAALAAAARAAPLPDLGPLRARVLAHAPRAAVVPPPVHPARPAWWPAPPAILAGAAALVVAALGWSALDAFSVGPAAPLEDGAALEPLAIDSPAALRGTAPVAPRREPLATPEQVDASAVLVVRVRWESDGAPAAGVAVRFLPAGEEGDLQERVATSDGDGIARFPAPLPGPATLHPDRGGEGEVEVRRAGTTVADLSVPSGVLVQGTARDAQGRPVAGAGIWLSSAPRDVSLGAMVTVTAGDGTFAIRDVAPGRLLAACADGFTPGPVRRVPFASGAPWQTEVTLGDESRGRVFGQVVDEAGQPIANAKVLLGVPCGQLPATGVADENHVPAHATSTDSIGRFRFLGVRCEELSLRACAPHRALVQTSVNVTGATEVVLTLAAEAVLTGTATDRYGEPAWRGEVGLDDPELRRLRHRLPRWARAETSPWRDGRFRLGHLAAGERGVRAADGDDVAHGRFVFRAGECVLWHAQLGEQSITGEVIDEHERPLAEWRVAASSATSTIFAITDRAGRFRLPGADFFPYEVAVREPLSALEIESDAVRVSGVVPGTPIRVVVPDAQRASARLRARIALPERWQGTRVQMRLARTGAESDDCDAEFRRPVHLREITNKTAPAALASRLLRPGRYTMTLTAPELGELHVRPVVLQPEADVDLGTLRFEVPGALDIEVVSPDGAPCSWLAWRRGENQAVHGVAGSVRVVRGRAQVGPLQPGIYDVTSVGTTLAGVRVQVVAGNTASARLVLGSLVARRFMFPATAADRTRWRILDAAGGLVHECGVHGMPGRPGVRVLVAPGRYTIEAEDRLGARAAAEVQVTAAADGDDIVLPVPER